MTKKYNLTFRNKKINNKPYPFGWGFLFLISLS